MSTRDEWTRRIARWERSGLSRSEFAIREGVKPTTLSWWRWSLRRGAPRSTALVRRDVEFVEVEAVGVADVHERIEIALANGRVVRVPTSFDDGALGRVLDVADRR